MGQPCGFQVEDGPADDDGAEELQSEPQASKFGVHEIAQVVRKRELDPEPEPQEAESPGRADAREGVAARFSKQQAALEAKVDSPRATLPF